MFACAPRAEQLNKKHPPVSWLVKVCHHKWKVEQQHVDLHTTSRSCTAQNATHCNMLSYEVKLAYQNDCKYIPDTAEIPLQNHHTCWKTVHTVDARMNDPSSPQDLTNTKACQKISAHAVWQLPLRSYQSSAVE